MNFGPVKGSPLYIFDNFLADFSLTIIAIVYAVVKGNIDALLENTVLLVFALIGPVSRVISYLCTSYEVNDGHLIVRKGFLSKSVQEVPLSSITSVDVSAKVFYRILKSRECARQPAYFYLPKLQTPFQKGLFQADCLHSLQSLSGIFHYRETDL